MGSALIIPRRIVEEEICRILVPHNKDSGCTRPYLLELLLGNTGDLLSEFPLFSQVFLSNTLSFRKIGPVFQLKIFFSDLLSSTLNQIPLFKKKRKYSRNNSGSLTGVSFKTCDLDS